MVAIAIYAPAILAIIISILVLIWPKLLRLGVGIYLILLGLLQLIKF
ncbi:MAG: DUF3096 domain-containing protein [Candidatus Pacearchaeota archaeon]|nr:DUF3096 domain-containing protein [Candidatus Pacearchaeota archaeon]